LINLLESSIASIAEAITAAPITKKSNLEKTEEILHFKRWTIKIINKIDNINRKDKQAVKSYFACSKLSFNDIWNYHNCQYRAAKFKLLSEIENDLYRTTAALT
jgi:hypothetical protein